MRYFLLVSLQDSETKMKEGKHRLSNHLFIGSWEEEDNVFTVEFWDQKWNLLYSSRIYFWKCNLKQNFLCKGFMLGIINKNNNPCWKLCFISICLFSSLFVFSGCDCLIFFISIWIIQRLAWYPSCPQYTWGLVNLSILRFVCFFFFWSLFMVFGHLFMFWMSWITDMSVDAVLLWK